MTLTQKDLDEIENIVDEKIGEKIKNLPTKDQFFSKMDEVVGELKAIREELPSINSQLSNHEDRIEKVESKLNISPSD
jgi:predicted nuclease with TOPRIM domain